MKENSKKQITEIIRKGIAAGEIPGCSVLVQRAGQEVFYYEAGCADIKGEEKIRRDSIFRLYSMSKPITAAAVMILMERGLISLCEPVGKYIPAYREMKCYKEGNLVKADSEITIKQLLDMTSGLVYGSADINSHPSHVQMENIFAALTADLDQGKEHTTVEVAEMLAASPLKFEPGTSWEYGTSADVLGAVVEAASGIRFGEFLETELFGPLNMKKTGFYVKEESDLPKLVKAYDCSEIPASEYHGNHLNIFHKMDHAPLFESGGAGLVSTVDDYSHFAAMLLNNGEYEGKRVLSAASVKYLTAGELTKQQQHDFSEKNPGLLGYTYHNLMRVMKKPGMASILSEKGEYGWDGWLGCVFANFPESQSTFLFMTQVKDAGFMPITRKVRNAVLAGLSTDA